MSIKLSIGLMMFAGLLPFVLIAMLTDLTRGRAMMLAAAGVIAALCVMGARTGPGSRVVAWLSVSQHATMVICTLAILFAAIVLIIALLDRRRRRELAWRSLPSQLEFSRYCIRYLLRQGWEEKAAYMTNQMTVCRMENASIRVTFIFTVIPVDPRVLSTRLKALKWKDYGQHVVVTWQRQVTTYRQAANDVGWDVVGSDQLGRMVDGRRTLHA